LFGGGGGGVSVSSTGLVSADTQGGGYTGLFFEKESQSNALLIAGGGGAAPNSMPGGKGGAGGGLVSQVAFAPWGYPCSQQNQEAGQTFAPPYAGPLLGAGGLISPFPYSSGITTGYRIGGSGGGYFGGGLSTYKSNCSFGAGGSGFIASSIQDGVTTTGDYNNPANNTDIDYIPGSAIGTSTRIKAGSGLAVIFL
jgi:hypothetical protein